MFYYATLYNMENLKACSIIIDAEMHKRLKARAALEDTSISALIGEALILYLAEPSNVEKAAHVNGPWAKRHAAKLAAVLLVAKNALAAIQDDSK